MTLVMFDAITIANIPANPQAVAGYVGGNWPTYRALVARFPNAHHLSVAVNAGEDAECLDIESGDAVPGQAPAWVRRQQGRGIARPVVYSSASEMPAVLSALAGAGIARSQVRVWSAHFTFREHICTPSCGYGFTADATQWTDRALGRSLDQSLVGDSFFGAPAPPPPPPPPKGTKMIQTYMTADHRVGFVVETDQGEVLHIEQQNAPGTAGSTDFWRHNDGTANWLSLGKPGQ